MTPVILKELHLYDTQPMRLPNQAKNNVKQRTALLNNSKDVLFETEEIKVAARAILISRINVELKLANISHYLNSFVGAPVGVHFNISSFSLT